MEGSWHHNEWIVSATQTKPAPWMENTSSNSFWESVPIPELQESHNAFQAIVRMVLTSPYHPHNRVKRGDALLFKFGYPELAAADSYKAILLSDAALKQSGELSDKVWDALEKEMMWKGSTESVEYLRTTRLEAYKLLINALYFLNAKADMLSVCREAIEKHPNDQNLQDIIDYIQQWRNENGYGDRFIGTGRIRRVRYPWLSPEQFGRSKDIILAANEYLQKRSDFLEIRESSIQNTTSGDLCFGMFAKRDISAGTRFLNSLGPFGVSTNQMVDRCYNCCVLKELTHTMTCCPDLRFCSRKCKEIARKYYHKALCGKDHKGFYDGLENLERNDPKFDITFWLRILATCLQDKDIHPLQHPLIRQLTAEDSGLNTTPWFFEVNIIGPLVILEKLGESIFDNNRYDAWVLETIWSRTSNNVAVEYGRVTMGMMDPMYSFFNHSCYESSIDEENRRSSRVVLKTKQSFSKDEEVFIQYFDCDGTTIEERQRLLQHWLPDDCTCGLCQEEYECTEEDLQWLMGQKAKNGSEEAQDKSA